MEPGTRISGRHLQELGYARQLLEKPSLAARLTDALGAPIEKGLELLPEKWAQTVHESVQKSLNRALEVAVRSLGRREATTASEQLHKMAVIATGATGGAFGLAGLVVELPVSTTIMLRSVADIARSEGEDLESVESQLSCLEVFALGGRSPADDAAETGYFAIRSALAAAVSEAARHIAEKGMVEQGAPALVRFLLAIASRFGVAASQKMAAMAIPAIGAAGGAIINSLFISHFQDTSRGHFIVRRLEREYGKELVRQEYERLFQ